MPIILCALLSHDLVQQKWGMLALLTSKNTDEDFEIVDALLNLMCGSISVSSHHQNEKGEKDI